MNDEEQKDRGREEDAVADMKAQAREALDREGRESASVGFQATLFNARYPVGTVVDYWPGRLTGPSTRTVTRSEAAVLGGHTAVVWVAGRRDCVALDHVKPVEGKR